MSRFTVLIGVSVLVLWLSGLQVFAQETSIYKRPAAVDNITKTNDIGVGLNAGTANGVNAKYWMSEHTALAASAAFSQNNTALALDYLYHFRNWSETYPQASNVIAPYGGLGVITAFGSGTNQYFNTSVSGSTGTGGLRVPVGIEYLPHAVPVGVFAEIDPGLGVTPATYGFFQAEVGGRWYF